MGAVPVRSLFFLWTAMAVAACSSAPKQSGEVRLGMTKDELRAILGAPYEVRDPVPNARGQMDEVWLYYTRPEVQTGRDVATGVLTSGVGFFADPTEGHRYLFHFVGDRLESWGPER